MICEWAAGVKVGGVGDGGRREWATGGGNVGCGGGGWRRKTTPLSKESFKNAPVPSNFGRGTKPFFAVTKPLFRVTKPQIMGYQAL